MHPSWKPILNSEFEKPYFQELSNFLTDAYSHKTIYPPKTQVFSAFTTDLDSVKVIIIGQDPYHTPGAAHGLAFSVPANYPIPPSLQNILKEIRDDCGHTIIDQFLGVALPTPKNQTQGGRKKGERVPLLSPWASQGVLLLNNTLTVEAHRAGSHRGRGWEQFTENIIKYLSEKRPRLVFILWGRDARSKKILIDAQKHFVLEAAHPSPFSAHSGFFGCRHFSKTNTQLKAWNLPEITW